MAYHDDDVFQLEALKEEEEIRGDGRGEEGSVGVSERRMERGGEVGPFSGTGDVTCAKNPTPRNFFPFPARREVLKVPLDGARTTGGSGAFEKVSSNDLPRTRSFLVHARVWPLCTLRVRH